MARPARAWCGAAGTARPTDSNGAAQSRAAHSRWRQLSGPARSCRLRRSRDGVRSLYIRRELGQVRGMSPSKFFHLVVLGLFALLLAAPNTLDAIKRSWEAWDTAGALLKAARTMWSALTPDGRLFLLVVVICFLYASSHHWLDPLLRWSGVVDDAADLLEAARVRKSITALRDRLGREDVAFPQWQAEMEMLRSSAFDVIAARSEPLAELYGTIGNIDPKYQTTAFLNPVYNLWYAAASRDIDHIGDYVRAPPPRPNPWHASGRQRARVALPPIKLSTVADEIGMFEAATRAYEETRNLFVGKYATHEGSGDDILTWYCYATASLVPIVGNQAPSRAAEAIPASAMNTHKFVVIGKAIILQDRYGAAFWENLRVRHSDLVEAIKRIAQWGTLLPERAT